MSNKVSTFRERFTELINDSPKSQAAIASEFGVAKQTISAWITGQSSPRLPVVSSLAEYFDVSLEWLLGYDAPKHTDWFNRTRYVYSININSDNPFQPNIDNNEIQLIQTYRSLPEKGKEYLLQQSQIAKITFGEKPAVVSDSNAK